ncbi:hypothetical protein BH24DEI2_BH24DEI2_26770 [soil metagenome]
MLYKYYTLNKEKLPTMNDHEEVMKFSLRLEPGRCDDAADRLGGGSRPVEAEYLRRGARIIAP